MCNENVSLNREEQEKEAEKARKKEIAKLGLSFLAWVAAALISIGLLVFVLLILFGVVRL